VDYPTSPTIGLIAGKFSDGDPAAGVPASIDPAVWMNAVTDEMINLIITAGLTPSDTIFTQIRDAVIALSGAQVNTAAVAPAITDDSSLGYSVGSIWIDTATSIAYRCFDATAGAAVWHAIPHTDTANTWTGNQTVTGNLYVTGIVQAGVV
jgi:hypothetical protein